ncbi:MAG: DUF1579 domain-containing protein [Lysobacteraceae bacterium]|nr:MAG: DUF1579 domain-containing protein [Xanthomonadaceae bacterium]
MPPSILGHIHRSIWFLFASMCWLPPATSALAQNASPPGLLSEISRQPEMDRIAGLIGTWRMTPSYLDQASGEWREGEVFYAAFDPQYDGRYLRSEFVMPMPGLPAFRMSWTLSYDRYRKRYRMAVLENVVGLMDIYEGEWQGDALQLDDKRTGTSAPGANGQLIFARFVVRFESPARARITMQAWRKHSDEEGAWVDGIRIAMDKQSF